MTSAVRTASGHASSSASSSTARDSTIAIGLADGSITTQRDAERQVIEVLSELGYVDSQGRELDQRWLMSLTEPVLDFTVLGAPAHAAMAAQAFDQALVMHTQQRLGQIL